MNDLAPWQNENTFQDSGHDDERFRDGERPQCLSLEINHLRKGISVRFWINVSISEYGFAQLFTVLVFFFVPHFLNAAKIVYFFSLGRPGCVHTQEASHDFRPARYTTVEGRSAQVGRKLCLSEIGKICGQSNAFLCLWHIQHVGHVHKMSSEIKYLYVIVPI